MSERRFFVGIGASAGGLEALSSLFSTMPSKLGATYIVVQHLSPDFKSLMDELLSKFTPMDIKIATNDMATEENTIYLIPPRSNLTIVDGHLYLEEYPDNKTLHMPIDIFFQSLANDQTDRAIAVILSGTGSDGSRGIRSINEHGGLVIAQSMESSRFDGMPRNAIATGICDYILRPEDIATEIAKYMEQPNVIPSIEHVEESFELQQLKRIGIIMNVYSGIDFNMYKSSTILRRIERRIKVNKLTQLDDYIQFLLRSDKEKEILKKDFLIGVTGFFRDNGAFEALSEKAFPYIDLNQPEIRIWVAGCSTGEEAYSIAIRFQEFMDQKGATCQFKLFATDINVDSIDIANIGHYSASVIEAIPQDIIHKYFEPKQDGYRIMEHIRKRIVFAKHNLLLDPPFSKLDLLVCRNVLIYIKPEFQENIIRQFYRSLNKDGVLFLGSSESLGSLQEVYHSIDKKWNLYRRNNAFHRKMMEEVNYNINYRYREPLLHDTSVSRAAKTSNESILTAIISSVVEAGILIDSDDKIVQVINDCTLYLQPQPGKFTNTINSNVRKDFILIINNILRRLRNKERNVTYRNVKANEINFSIQIDGVRIATRDEEFYLITFGKEKPIDATTHDKDIVDYSAEKTDRIEYLERELHYAKENLQATVEELETSNEELQSSNEELIASNEELQSTNEELQSVNEELYSVNNEYQSKIEALTSLTNDLSNLLNNTEVAAIYLDKHLKIRKITPLIQAITNLRDDDVNRPFNHISVMEGYPNIIDDVKRVNDTLEGFETNVVDSIGRTWYCKIKPYRRERNIVEGIIITFVEITNYADQMDKTKNMESVLDYVLKSVDIGWFLLDIKQETLRGAAEFYTNIGFQNDEIPTTIDDLYGLVVEDDLGNVRTTYFRMMNQKQENFDIVFHIQKHDKTIVKIRQMGEYIDGVIVGTSLIVLDE